MPIGADILGALAALVQNIVATLSAITRDLTTLAVLWHLAIGALLVALWAGWRPSAKLGLVLVVAPIASVAIVALVYGNPFNAISFAILAVILVTLASAFDAVPTASGAPWSTAIGVALVGFGATYPHFVEGAWYRALYAAPIGLVPCPTLAVAAGFTLLAGGFRGRAVCAVLGAWAAGYALFGMARLGVILDAGLAIAACGLFAMALRGLRLHSGGGAHSYSR